MVTGVGPRRGVWFVLRRLVSSDTETTRGASEGGEPREEAL